MSLLLESDRHQEELFSAPDRLLSGVPPALAGRLCVLINSGAYVDQELSAEFGAIPPAFLPVGLNRLYERQALMFADGPSPCDMFLTLPASFDIPDWDQRRLKDLGFRIIRTPDALSLGDALLHALAHIGFRQVPLRLLHGDTLLVGLDIAANDLVAVAQTRDGYRWPHAQTSADGRIVHISPADGLTRRDTGATLCGYFAFADAIKFVENLTLAGGNFLSALNADYDGRTLSTFEPTQWLDFGHVQTYYQSRRIVTTARAFNSLEFASHRVRKRSTTQPAKLKAEAMWLKTVPADIMPFCVRLLEDGEDRHGYFYDTEYQYMPTLSELHLMGALKLTMWERILDSCGRFIAASIDAADGEDDGALSHLVIEKTGVRLEEYAHSVALDLDAPNTLNGEAAPSIAECLEGVSDVIRRDGQTLPSLMHGDFCFSNIFYNTRMDRVCLIDPRGANGADLIGDARYDIAKLMHSISGRYDLILAGRGAGRRVGPNAFDLHFLQRPDQLQIEDMARNVLMGSVRLDSDVISAAVVSLFLSMAPLHADRPDRQAAFIANALRLYMRLDNDCRDSRVVHRSSAPSATGEAHV